LIESAAVAATDTKALIAQAVERLGEELPALRQLKLVVKLELRARRGDALLDVSIPRSHFNELAKDGRLRHWIDAYERGHVKVSGDAAVIKLLGNVIERQRVRSRV
jgi:hypothetical protein